MQERARSRTHEVRNPWMPRGVSLGNPNGGEFRAYFSLAEIAQRMHLALALASVESRTTSGGSGSRKAAKRFPVATSEATVFAFTTNESPEYSDQKIHQDCLHYAPAWPSAMPAWPSAMPTLASDLPECRRAMWGTVAAPADIYPPEIVHQVLRKYKLYRLQRRE